MPSCRLQKGSPATERGRRAHTTAERHVKDSLKNYRPRIRTHRSNKRRERDHKGAPSAINVLHLLSSLYIPTPSPKCLRAASLILSILLARAPVVCLNGFRSGSSLFYPPALAYMLVWLFAYYADKIPRRRNPRTHRAHNVAIDLAALRNFRFITESARMAWGTQCACILYMPEGETAATYGYVEMSMGRGVV